MAQKRFIFSGSLVSAVAGVALIVIGMMGGTSGVLAAPPTEKGSAEKTTGNELYGTFSLYGEYDATIFSTVPKTLYGSPDILNVKKEHPSKGAVKQTVAKKAKPSAIRTAAPIATKTDKKQSVRESKADTKSKPNPLPETPMVKAKSLSPIKALEPAVPIKTIDSTPAIKTVAPQQPNPAPTIAAADVKIVTCDHGIVDETAPAPVVIAANPSAHDIAKSLTDTVDVDAYCKQINLPVKGALPEGVILMPGRLDQMSCVQR